MMRTDPPPPRGRPEGEGPAVAVSYTAPVIVEVGSVAQTVRGTQYQDSADDTQYKT
ncbi:hypothetical protein AB0P37_31930 [Streptomyces antimycoticus]|uniref:hypothetical protein n=1 Tax=Streptomyces antimycoticus TaxID=68175 RepID=UPI003439E1B7